MESEHEPPLPPPPHIRHRSPALASQSHSQPSLPKPFPYRNASRPRPSSLEEHPSSQPDPSSDPPLFSSDDVPASGLENYDSSAPVASGSGSGGSRSRKRRYRGTWWGAMVKENDPKRKRADFKSKDKRLVDSGVWMGSDDVSLKSDPILLSEDVDGNGSNWGDELVREAQVDSGDGQLGMGGMRPPLSLPQSRPLKQPVSRLRAVFKPVEEPAEYQLARNIVNDCLEKGQDSVDLSNGNLRTIPPGLLLPLQHLTKFPAIKEPPISEDVYTSLKPFLRLFLAGNALQTVSGDLFELDTLKVLSLRNNKLTEIPAGIRKLTMLQDVNLAVNRLQWLPWEVLWLIKKGDLKLLTVRQNPLWKIEDAEIATWHSIDGAEASSPEEALKLLDYEGPAPEEAWAPIHVATSPVRLYNMEGIPVDGSTTTLTPPRDPLSRVPSLREISLLAFNKLSPDPIPESEMAHFPGLTGRLLQLAQDVRLGGGRCCSVCHRSFVIARAEWIEWWDCSVYENGLKGPRAPGQLLRPLPFRRLGCSWACLPGVEGRE